MQLPKKPKKKEPLDEDDCQMTIQQQVRQAPLQLLKQLLFEEECIEKNLELLFKQPKNFPRKQQTVTIELEKQKNIPIGVLMDRLKGMSERQLQVRRQQYGSGRAIQSQKLEQLWRKLKGMNLYSEITSSRMFQQ